MSNQLGQVNPVRRTWWVKVRRAEKHLGDIRDHLSRLRENRRPYDVVTSIETRNDVNFLCVRGYLPRSDKALEEELEDFAALVGDFGNNVRAALDHICVALGRDDNQFPIFTADPWVPDIDSKTGVDMSEARRNGFKKCTAGVPKGALELIKSVQPYKSNAANVEFDSLALLAHLTNSDKHRRLLVTANYLCNVQCTVTYPGYEAQVSQWGKSWSWHGADGAIISDYFLAIPDLEPVVEASGGFEIGLQEVDRRRSPNADWVLPGTLIGILTRVKDEVLTPLDAMIT
jgi:hypothetical protein